MSNGAYFINILASQRSETIAAIALHSGELPLLEISAQRKYPVMIIHGTEDKIVKVSEGRKMRDMYRKEGHEVIYVEISDLGHTWAWEKHNINQKIWDFFISHPFYAK
jgi:predicted esterase